MNITLGSDNSVAVTRGEKITRGQSRSKLIKVNWQLGESPPELQTSNTKHIGIESLIVQVNIKRPDGEYSGWQDMIKVDGEISYYYPLQKWDTEVSGKAQCQIRWLKAGDDDGDDDTTIQISNEISFVIDNGVIAQTLLPTFADYTTWQAIIAGLQNNAMRKYDATNIPNSAVYNVDGKKSAPAIYFNVSNGDYSGLLVVSKNESNENIVQIETLFTDEGIFARTITFIKIEYNDNNNENPDGTATEWKDITKQSFSEAQLNALNSGIDSAKVEKLNGIESGAQVNAPNTVIDADYVHTDNNFTNTDKTKLEGIESGAEVNAVDSVNGQTGAVVLDSDDIDDSNSNNKFITTAEKTQIETNKNNIATIDVAYGATLDFTVNPSTYVLTAILKNKNGTALSTQEVDLPLESVVVSGRYDDTTKKVILTLQNGSTIGFSVADLVSGLQSEITLQNKLSADLIENGITNKVFTSNDKNTYDNHIANKNNPHEVTKAQVGLGNVDNTSDLDKPISTATQNALNGKVNSSSLTQAFFDSLYYVGE